MRLIWLPLFIFGSMANIAKAGSIEGLWVPPAGDAIISIVEEDTLRISLRRTLDPTLLDTKNPDKRLRSRPLSGILLGQGFKSEGSSWVDGHLYDPGSGKTYRGRITQIDENHIELRGYVGTPVFGRSEVWTRFELFRSRMMKMLSKEPDD
ncbi:MAG: DUF2147 domain-containing protein [Proteobacteria bacterium]|nr:DUF2147 domain-containing protein [Pseudomonadota bacterium]